MNERLALQNQISAVGFSMWELHLLLDTQPTDLTAMALLNKNMELYNSLVQQYESKFGPISTFNVDTNNQWQWIADPWPWEYSANAEV